VELEAVQLPTDAVEVGRVLGAFGIKGNLKVLPFSASPEALFSSKRWVLVPPEGKAPLADPPGSACRLLRVSQAREHGDTVLVVADGIHDRDTAQALAGWRVHVPRASFPTPEAGEYYWVDLIGCAVRNRQGQDLGAVTRLIETGPGCVLALSSDDAEGQPRLIPFVAAYVDQVDTAARTILVDWPADF
jgi:16S rRNA processing protein RimM